MKRGYTLIELLITIAIIAIMATLLISIMGTMVQKQKAMVCVSNMKDIMAATFNNAGDRNGFFPEVFRNDDGYFNNIPSGNYGWEDWLAPYMGYTLTADQAGSTRLATENFGDDFLESFRCPASDQVGFSQGKEWIIKSYKMHQASGVGGVDNHRDPWFDDKKRGLVAKRQYARTSAGFFNGNVAKMAQIVAPSEAIIYSEDHGAGNLFGEITGLINLGVYSDKYGPQGNEITDSFTLEDAWVHEFGSLTYALCDGSVKYGELQETVNEDFQLWAPGQSREEKGNKFWDCWPEKD